MLALSVSLAQFLRTRMPAHHLLGSEARGYQEDILRTETLNRAVKNMMNCRTPDGDQSSRRARHSCEVVTHIFPPLMRAVKAAPLSRGAAPLWRMRSCTMSRTYFDSRAGLKSECFDQCNISQTASVPEEENDETSSNNPNVRNRSQNTIE